MYKKMDKQKIKTPDGDETIPFKYKSYSIDEIMAAGGPIAFSDKLGKNSRNILAELKKLPKDAFLTEEEAALALETLRKTK
jgi:hypothetical protein